jgi:transcriptional regulator with XRE-family HTH domain
MDDPNPGSNIQQPRPLHPLGHHRVQQGLGALGGPELLPLLQLGLGIAAVAADQLEVLVTAEVFGEGRRHARILSDAGASDSKIALDMSGEVRYDAHLLWWETIRGVERPRRQEVRKDGEQSRSFAICQMPCVIAYPLSRVYDRGMRAATLLRHSRRQAGMTQRQLASAAGTPQSTIGRIETGRLNPTLDNLRHLLRAAGQDLELAPVAGADEDRTLIRDRLRLTPAARAALAVKEARAAARLQPHAATKRA